MARSGPRSPRTLLVIVGLLSLVVAASLLLTQRDYKRMLAYHSVEHMGLIALGAAAGTPLAIAAVLLHILGPRPGQGRCCSSPRVRSCAEGTSQIEGVQALLARRPVLGGIFGFGLWPCSASRPSACSPASSHAPRRVPGRPRLGRRRRPVCHGGDLRRGDGPWPPPPARPRRLGDAGPTPRAGRRAARRGAGRSAPPSASPPGRSALLACRRPGRWRHEPDRHRPSDPVGAGATAMRRHRGAERPARRRRSALRRRAFAWPWSPRTTTDVAMRVVYLFIAGPPDRRIELIVALERDRPEVPSLAASRFRPAASSARCTTCSASCPSAHPHPRRLVLHQHWPEGWHPMRHDAGPRRRAAPTRRSFPFVPVEGPGVYEIPVGPVHAGLIEPGHFRFSVVGESILKHEGPPVVRPQGHRTPLRRPRRRTTAGARRADLRRHRRRPCPGLLPGRRGRLASTVTEDAGSAARPAARTGAAVQPRRRHRRAVQRRRLRTGPGPGPRLCANTSCGSTAKSPATGCLRGGVIPGGVRVRSLPSPSRATEVARALRRARRPRHFEHTRHGPLHRHGGPRPCTSRRARVLGFVARASGLDSTPASPTPPSTPVERLLARGAHRRRRAGPLPSGSTRCGHRSALLATTPRPPAPSTTWHRPRTSTGNASDERSRHRRGMARHHRAPGRGRRGRTPDPGQGRRPSFLNWPALPVALADTIVPDFPLANKSFNLSYAGNDL